MPGELVKALTAPGIKPRLEKVGLRVIASTPEQFALELKNGIAAYDRARKSAELKSE